MRQNWMYLYHVEPTPELFVEEIRKWAKEGAFADPHRELPILVFLSCILAANPLRVKAWFDALSDLGPDNWYTLKVAAWHSCTPEAHAYLAEKAWIEEGWPPPCPVEHSTLFRAEVDADPILLDALWAHYFATGNHKAIRRIICALDYMGCFGAAKAYATTQKTEEDGKRALRDGIFQAASWSLKSVMKDYPPLKAFCAEQVRTGGDLTSNERCALAIILSELEPDIWHVHIDSKTGSASIGWRSTPDLN